MDAIFKYKKNCYNLTDAEGEYIREWTNNGTSDTLIEVGMSFLMPHIKFTKLSSNQYQWCGPMLIIAEQFGKLSQTRSKTKLNPEE